MFRYLILGLLQESGRLHGYALMKAYLDRSGTKMGSGTFYRQLARLVVEGLVEMATRSPGEDPRRAPYQCTEAGREAFNTWLTGPHRAHAEACDDELSVAVLFLSEADPAIVERLVRSLQEDLWLRGKVLERAREVARVRRDTRPGVLDTLDLLIGRRQKHVAADVEFLEELQRTYRAWAAEKAKKPSVQVSDRGAQGRPRRATR
jgi:DNA-binding PadR family transcriptional regulator